MTGDVVGPASAVDNNIVLFDGTTGKLIKDGGIAPTSSFGITINGGEAGPTTGAKGEVTVPFSCTITNYYLAANATGSCVIDVKRSGSSIVGGGNKPTLSSASSSNAAVSGWTSVTVTAGDIISFNVDSVSGSFSRVNLVLKVTRTS